MKIQDGHALELGVAILMLKIVYQTDQRPLCNPLLNHQPAPKPQDTMEANYEVLI